MIQERDWNWPKIRVWITDPASGKTAHLSPGCAFLAARPAHCGGPVMLEVDTFAREAGRPSVVWIGFVRNGRRRDRMVHTCTRCRTASAPEAARA